MVRRRSGADRESMRGAMMAMREETTKKLAEVFSEEQMEKYEEMMAQRRQGRGPF